jgi:hypothetical protein
MVGTSDARRKKGGKSDPRVRFLVKECVPTLLGSMFSLYQWLLKPYLKPIEKAREALSTPLIRHLHGLTRLTEGGM